MTNDEANQIGDEFVAALVAEEVRKAVLKGLSEGRARPNHFNSSATLHGLYALLDEATYHARGVEFKQAAEALSRGCRWHDWDGKSRTFKKEAT